MLGRRTLYSLAQFLALQEHSVVYVLLSKYGASLDGNNIVQIAKETRIYSLSLPTD